MEITLILSIVSMVVGILGMCVFAYNIRVSKVGATLKSKKDIKRERLLQRFRDNEVKRLSDVTKIRSSCKTHVANYTKYRYTGASKRDVEVWHSPTNIWVPYYLMFNTPFEDSSIRYNGEDVTSSGNFIVIAQQGASESTLSSSQYDGSIDNDSRDTVRSRSYYDDSYSSSSSSDSYSDSGSSSSSSSSYD